MLNALVHLLGGFGLAIVCFVYVLKHPEKVEKWEALVYRAGSWLSERFRRRSLSLQIQSRVNTACAAIAAEAPGAIPHALRIEWAGNVVPEAFVRNEECLIRMCREPNDDGNTVRATMAYLSRALLPNTRRYMRADLRTAADLAVAARILRHGRSSSTVNYFYEEVWGPYTASKPGVAEYAAQLTTVDSDGLLTRLFLPELGSLGFRVGMRSPDERIAEEIDAFLEYLDVLAGRSPSEEVELSFIARDIRVHVILVAKQETIKRAGTEPHADRLRDAITKGADRVYLLAIRDENVSMALGVAKQAQRSALIGEPNIMVYQLASLRGRGYNSAVCIRCEAPEPAAMEEPPPLDEVLLEAAHSCFDEISVGQVEVVATARQGDLVAKIAVRSADRDIATDRWVGEVRGSDREEALRQSLGVQRLDIIAGSDDLCQLAVAALYPLRPSAVKQCWEDTAGKEIWLDVDNPQNASVAIGSGGANIRAANKLVGRRLMVFSAPLPDLPGRQGEPSSEERGAWRLDQAVISAVRNNVPEVAKGDIEIMAVGYVKREACLIAVRGADRNLRAIATCVGKQGRRASAIKAALNVPYVLFFDWDPDPCRLAINALPQLTGEDVVGIDADVNSDQIRIKVRTGGDRESAVAKVGRNLKAAQLAIGRPILFSEDGEESAGAPWLEESPPAEAPWEGD